jgi:DNA replication and repair protein RecF
MWLERLEVEGVRNLEPAALTLRPGLNLFWGANGAGKTALLEAVHVLARGRSFRGTRVQPLIQRGKSALLVRARVRDEGRGAVDIAMAKDRHNTSELRIAGQTERRVSAAAALVPMELFLPEGSDLVFGNPAGRRGFLDWAVFHVKPRHLQSLQRYQRVLRQRNALLLAAGGGRSSPRRGSLRFDELTAWTEQLVASAADVDADRREYVAMLGPALQEVLRRLTDTLAGVSVEYRSGWSPSTPFVDALSEGLERDVKFGSTQLGPHRAELRLTVDADGAAAAETLSRGQGKLLASALRVAQVHLTKRLTGRGTLLLIDDLGAELDAMHSHRFFALLAASECQVLATCVTPLAMSEFDRDRRATFHVEHGRIELGTP